MTSAEFQLYKAGGVAAALFFAGLLQWRLPYRPGFREQALNWRVNLPLALFNVVVLSFLCGGCAYAAAVWAETHGFGLLAWLHAPRAARALISIAALDFVAYAWHRANHHVPLLWRFHAVHHSDGWFDASTAVRFHPGEILISLGVRVAAVVALGLPVEGILAFEIVYALFNFFEHGNIRLGTTTEQWLSALFVTPALHRKHHSVNRDELNSNFGTIFSFWDKALRTHRPSSSAERIIVGLPGEPSPFRLPHLLAMPFRRA